MSTIVDLKNFALNEKSRRQANLNIQYKLKNYNPFDFINSTYLSLLYQAKDGYSTDVRSVVLPNDVWATTLYNSDIVEFMSLAMGEIQKHLDGYQQILNYIDSSSITDSSQIIPAWDSYLSTYVNPRHKVLSNQELLTLIQNLQLPVQSDWLQTNTNRLDYIKNKPPLPIQASAVRALNSIFQISSTRSCFVNYSVDVSCTLSLTSGQSGTVFLEIASDLGFTTNVQEVARFNNGNSGTLAIGLNLTQTITGTLSGFVPIGYYVRLRTSNIIGTATFSYRSGQEILF